MSLKIKYKQVIIIRTDLKMSVGKKVAQGCHASVIAVENARKMYPAILGSWGNEGQRKIALKVQSEDDLIDVYRLAKSMHLPCCIIQDAGLTQLEPGTKTAVGIGPALSNDIDRITKTLKLL